jgi:hypothetical protein
VLRTITTNEDLDEFSREGFRYYGDEVKKEEEVKRERVNYLSFFIFFSLILKMNRRRLGKINLRHEIFSHSVTGKAGRSGRAV